MTLDMAIDESNAFPAKSSCLLFAAACGQLPVGTDDPPPGKPLGGGQNVAHRPSRPRIPGAPGHFTVADDLPALKITDDGPNGLDEGHLRFSTHDLMI